MYTKLQSKSKSKYNQPFSSKDENYSKIIGQSTGWHESYRKSSNRKSKDNSINNINFYNNSEYLKTYKPIFNPNKPQNQKFIDNSIDSDENQNYSKVCDDLFEDSVEIKQRISHLIKKTRMNTMKRKSLTCDQINAENINLKNVSDIFTPRSKCINIVCNEGEPNGQTTTKNSTHRSPIYFQNIKNKSLSTSNPPYQIIENPKISSFAAPFGYTSSDFSKMFKKPSRSEISSANMSGPLQVLEYSQSLSNFPPSQDHSQIKAAELKHRYKKKCKKYQKYRSLKNKVKEYEDSKRHQQIEIEQLKEIIRKKDKVIQQCEQEINHFKSKIKIINHDFEEFKATNSRLREAQKKDSEIEFRQLVKRIEALENNKGIQNDSSNRSIRSYKITDSHRKESITNQTKVFLRSPFMGIQDQEASFSQKSNPSMDMFQLNKPVKVLR